MKTVYLFRHGDVEDAFRDRIRGGGTDCLLSDTGERMSLMNVEFLVRNNVQKVITSGMKRTNYIGEYLAKNYGIEHEADDRLKEMHMGEWEGTLVSEAHIRHPNESKAFLADPLSGVFPGLEDVSVYQKRILDAWEDAMRTNVERIAVIAHGITNAVILRSVLGTNAHPLTQTIGCMNEILVGPPPTLKQENVILY